MKRLIAWGASQETAFDLLMGGLEQAVLAELRAIDIAGATLARKKMSKAAGEVKIFEKACETCRVLVEETARKDFICPELHTQFVNLEIALRAGTVPVEQLSDFCTRLNSYKCEVGGAGRPRGAIWEFLLDHQIGRFLVSFAEERLEDRNGEIKDDEELAGLASKIRSWTHDAALPMASDIEAFFEQAMQLRQRKGEKGMTKAQLEHLAAIEAEYRQTVISQLSLYMKSGANSAFQMAASAKASGGLIQPQAVQETGQEALQAGGVADGGTEGATVLDLRALGEELFDAEFLCTFHEMDRYVPGISAEVQKFGALRAAVFPVLQFVLSYQEHLATRMEPIEASLDQLQSWVSIDVSVFDQANILDKWKQYYINNFLSDVQERLSMAVEEQAQRDIAFVKKLVQECAEAAGGCVICDNAAAARCKDSLIIALTISNIFNVCFLF